MTSRSSLNLWVWGCGVGCGMEGVGVCVEGVGECGCVCEREMNSLLAWTLVKTSQVYFPVEAVRVILFQYFPRLTDLGENLNLSVNKKKILI